MLLGYVDWEVSRSDRKLRVNPAERYVKMYSVVF